MPPDRRRRQALLIAIPVVLVIVLLIVLLLPKGDSVTIQGTVALYDANAVRNNCLGSGDFADVRPGLGVVITDDAGRVAGSGQIGAGTARADSRNTQFCLYTFSISNVPSNSPSYSISFNTGRHGVLHYPRADLVANGWRIEIQVGQ
jgi:hypothetical protein